MLQADVRKSGICLKSGKGERKNAMPIGVIINALSVVIGGILGALMGHKLSPKFKADITLVFGVCSMGMGISTIGLMENMPAVNFFPS